MSNMVKITKSKIDALASAIRAKEGTTGALTLEEMIVKIPDLKVYEAGTYDASDNLLKTWDELLSSGAVGYVNYDSSNLKSVSPTTNFAGVSRFVFPNDKGIKTISNNFFKDCTNIKNIILPNGVEMLGNNGVFEGCTSLESIKIPDSVVTFGSNTFKGCTSLKTVKMPATLPEGQLANAYIFQNSGLESIALSQGMTIIPSYTFAGCQNLHTVIMPNSLRTISLYAFQNCKALVEITIPNSVIEIDSTRAFQNCTNLRTIHYSGTATGAPWGATNATVVP